MAFSRGVREPHTGSIKVRFPPLQPLWEPSLGTKTSSLENQCPVFLLLFRISSEYSWWLRGSVYFVLSRVLGFVSKMSDNCKCWLNHQESIVSGEPWLRNLCLAPQESSGLHGDDSRQVGPAVSAPWHRGTFFFLRAGLVLQLFNATQHCSPSAQQVLWSRQGLWLCSLVRVGSATGLECSVVEHVPAQSHSPSSPMGNCGPEFYVLILVVCFRFYHLF